MFSQRPTRAGHKDEVRAQSVAGVAPKLWNKLPRHARAAPILPDLKILSCCHFPPSNSFSLLDPPAVTLDNFSSLKLWI